MSKLHQNKRNVRKPVGKIDVSGQETCSGVMTAPTTLNQKGYRIGVIQVKALM